MRRIALAIAVLLAAPAAARADETGGSSGGATFGAGNQSYVEGRFDQAIQRYEALVAAGVQHEDLYYNLGNAYFRSGRLGPAIHNYERALRIDPSHEDAQFNMNVAREAVAERVVDRLKGAESDPWWVRLATFFSVGHLTIAFLTLDVLFFGLLITLRFLATGFLRTALMATAGFVGVAVVGSLLLLRGHLYVLEEVHQGVVVADQVVMREGADVRAHEKGKLHPGVRVRLRGRDAGWLHVRLANGMEGWVPEDSVGKL